MAYGLSVRNRGGDAVFGTSHLSLNFYGSGVVIPQKGPTGGTLINYPGALSMANTFIFARPEPNFANADLGETQFSIFQEYSWPMGIRMEAGGFYITIPQSLATVSSSDINYKLANTGDSYTNSNSGKGKVYYEMWGPGNTEDETGPGLKTKTAAGDIIYSSNRKQFKPESIQVGRPRVNVNTSSGAVTYLNSMKFYMPNRTNEAQQNYLCLLNGCAHTTGFIKAGVFGATNNFETPTTSAALYQTFATWYYFDQDDPFGRQPFVEYRAMPAYTKNTSNQTIYQHAMLRKAEELGVPTVGMIGVSR
jgi:hypothetical protein